MSELTKVYCTMGPAYVGHDESGQPIVVAEVSGRMVIGQGREAISRMPVYCLEVREAIEKQDG